MEPAFYNYKYLFGSGSKIVNEFIKDLQSKFCQRIKKYARYREMDNEFEHIFYYGEQQTKTYITAVLDQICDTNFMQEMPIKRRTNKFKRKREILNNGYVDYWCRYGGYTKISILMEIKQSWIRYYNPEKYTVYEDVATNHSIAVKQLKDIRNKTDFIVDNLYGAALTILPLYSQYQSKRSEQVRLTDITINKIAKNAMRQVYADAYGYWIIPQTYCPIDTWYEKNYKIKKNVNHPGIIFLWSIQKYTRR